MSYLIWLLLEPWFLIIWCTWLFIFYTIELAEHFYTSKKKIPIYLQIILLLRYEVIIFDYHLVMKSE